MTDKTLATLTDELARGLCDYPGATAVSGPFPCATHRVVAERLVREIVVVVNVSNREAVGALREPHTGACLTDARRLKHGDKYCFCGARDHNETLDQVLALFPTGEHGA